MHGPEKAGAAQAWFQQLADQDLRRELALGLIEGMVEKDAAAALTFARSLPEGGYRETGLVRVARRLFSEDPAAAAELIAEVPFDPTNQDLRNYYSSWLASDGAAAIHSLLSRIGRSSEQSAAVQEFIESRLGSYNATLSSHHATALAEGGLPDADVRRKLLESMTKKWAANDLVNARTWAEALPDGAARERALAGVAAGWAASSINEVRRGLMRFLRRRAAMRQSAVSRAAYCRAIRPARWRG